MLKSLEELGIKGNHNFIEDPYIGCETSTELWNTFVKSMRDLGFDHHIVFVYSLGNERFFNLKNNEKYPWMVGTAHYHAYCSTGDPSIYETLEKRGIFENNPFLYHLANCKRAAMIGLDFLDPAMPNYETAKKFWEGTLDLGYRSAFCLPYEGPNPLTNHGFGLHSSLPGPVFEQMAQRVWKDVFLNCHRFTQRFYNIFPQEIAEEIGLTKKQYTTFRLFEHGFSNDEIANKMGVTAAAVSLHLKEIRKKINVTTNREISSKARRIGLIANA